MALGSVHDVCAEHKRGSQDGQALSVGHFQRLCGLCPLAVLIFDLLRLITKVNVYPLPSGFIFGSHIPAMFKHLGISKDHFCVLLNECFENE